MNNIIFLITLNFELETLNFELSTLKLCVKRFKTAKRFATPQYLEPRPAEFPPQFPGPVQTHKFSAPGTNLNSSFLPR